MQILWRNAQQILAIIEATFPAFEQDGQSSNCEDLGDNIDELACEFRIISRSLPSSNDEGENIDVWVARISKVSTALSRLRSLG